MLQYMPYVAENSLATNYKLLGMQQFANRAGGKSQSTKRRILDFSVWLSKHHQAVIVMATVPPISYSTSGSHTNRMDLLQAYNMKKSYLYISMSHV